MVRRIVGVLAGVYVGLFVVNAVGVIVFAQRLVRSYVGIAATVESPPASPVTITLSLPSGYGLPASERSWEPLNQPHVAEAMLADGEVQVVLPSYVTVCRTYPLWRKEPPPPAWLILTISDAPDQRYTLYRSGKRALVLVQDEAGDEVPESQAHWAIDVGDLAQVSPPDARPRTWVLHLKLRRNPPSPDSAEPRHSV